METQIRNVLPITRDSQPVDLHIDGRAITSITKHTDPTGDQLIMPARLATPGFINAHAHLAMVLFRGLADDVPLEIWLKEHVWPIEQQLQPDDIYWCTLLGIAEGIRSGTTAFIDMYFHNDQIAQAVEESGVRATLSYGMIATSLQDRGADELKVTESLIKRWHGAADGRLRVSVSPHAVYTCSEDVIRAGVEMVQKYETCLHIHVSETRSEVEDWIAKTGRSPVVYLQGIGAFSVPTLAAHCVHVDPDDISILSDHPVTVAHCPKSNAKLGSGISPIPAMQAAGVRVALGTDGAASNNRLDMIEELRSAWLLQRAHHEDSTLLGAADILDMAIRPARPLFGLPETGLVENAPADVVVFDAGSICATPSHDPVAMLAYALSAADVTDVMVDGKVLLKDGELHTIDEERVKWEVQRLLHRIKTR